jgi:hypothetical protein
LVPCLHKDQSMDELERALQSIEHLRQTRKRLAELKDRVARWAGGALAARIAEGKDPADSVDVTRDDESQSTITSNV